MLRRPIGGWRVSLHGVSDPGDARVDTELGRLESDLDSVESALAALDADDLDRAEALAASLDTPADVSAPADGPSDEA